MSVLYQVDIGECSEPRSGQPLDAQPQDWPWLIRGRHNNGDGRLSARPKGVRPIGQFGVAYRDVGNEREQGRGSVAALGKDLSHCQGLRLALADWVGSAPINIGLKEY